MHIPFNRLILLFASILVFNACSTTAIEQLNRTPSDSQIAPQNSYLAALDFGERLSHVSALEARILVQGADEPLAMGTLGSALLEKNPNSLLARHALMTFYKHVDTVATATIHELALTALEQAVRSSGDGSLEQPYKILSRADAMLFLQRDGQSVVGSIYQSNETLPLQLLLLSRENANSPITSTYYDMSALVDAVDGAASAKSTAGANPWDTLRILADSYDSAARAAIGTYLARQRRYEPAIGWLELAAQEKNLLAHTLLARIFWYQSGLPENQNPKQNTLALDAQELIQKAIENHAKAIDLGSTESMYTLGRLLLEDTETKVQTDAGFQPISAESKEERALSLLQQAGTLGHAESYLYLANQYQRGGLLPQNKDLANRYFAQAANLRNPKAIISYARYISGSPDQQSQTPLLPLLEELAESKNPKAMVVIGNLYAKGIEVRRSHRKAIRWYKKAVDQAQASHHGDTAVVNEVAWTLAVSNQESLQQPAYAQSIMDTMMQNNKQVQTHPEYLDTWAATYAANGNFPRAIELQKRALHFARTQQRNDVIGVLQNHLESFEAGDHLIDAIP